MKEHAKKALKHDFEVAGKTIPTLAIAALFLVGTGSAALLSNFGTVTGTATVDQPIQLDGENQKSATASYDSSTIYGGQTVATNVHTVQNNLNRTLAVDFQTEIQNGSGADWTDQSSITGVNAAHLIYSQHDNGDSDSEYDISVSKSEPLAEGDYSVHLESDGKTTDYATVWYDVSSVDVDANSVLKLDSQVADSHTHGSEFDEVYVVTSSGDVDVTQADGEDINSDGNLDLSSAEWYADGDSDPTLSNVEVIGLGYGDASAATEETGSNDLTVNLTIDNVRLGSTRVDEQGDVSLPVRRNVSFGAYSHSQVEGHTQSIYKFQTITTFDVAIAPQDYGVKTRLVPQ